MNWILVGAVSGLLAVGLGAFGAHGLKKVATAEALGWWQTAAHYHLVHAVVLVLVGVLAAQRADAGRAGWAFLLGTLLFSGSLYAMAVGAPRWLGAITPIGGLGLLLGWLLLALAANGRA
jgi:uncharacterized membrane protein YgdD (TMEM256/DUF423 family)